VRVVQVIESGVERGEGADQAGQHGHRMRVAPEPAQEELHLLVDHRMLDHARLERRALCDVGQIAVEQQVADFEKSHFTASSSIG